jgi:glycopeptide antibiotics resistance protein
MRKLFAIIAILGCLICYLFIFSTVPNGNDIFQGVFYGFLFFIPFSMLLWKIITKSSIQKKVIIIVFIIILIIWLYLYIDYVNSMNYLRQGGYTG